jgi:hypothetical protein
VAERQEVPRVSASAIYHGTHALFVRARAVFVLVWARDTESAAAYEHEGINFHNPRRKPPSVNHLTPTHNRRSYNVKNAKALTLFRRHVSIWRIDSLVLDAFLEVTEYFYGARSMGPSSI